MVKSRLWWVLPPYVLVYAGIAGLQSAWGALIGFHVSILSIVIINRRAVLPQLGVRVAQKVLLPVALAGLFAGVGLLVVWPYSGLQTELSSRLSGLGLSRDAWVLFSIYFIMINPWLEEAYWRNVLFSPSRILAPVDFLFAGYHLIILYQFVSIFWMFFAFVILVIAGWFWRQVSRHTGSLLPAVLSHMLADLSILLVLYHFSG